MIHENLRDVGKEILNKKGIRVVISVPKGKELAPKTDNPRLGIKDGISILGTSGIVIPFSTASYAASIRQNLDVAIAMGNDTVVLTTGGRSEEYAKKLLIYQFTVLYKWEIFQDIQFSNVVKKISKKHML